MQHMLYDTLRHYFNEDLPELLRLTATTLSDVRWPNHVNDLITDPELAFRFVPIFTGLVVISSAPFVLLFGTTRPRSYSITRMILLKGMGLIYFFAFLTSAFTSRALFGSNGLVGDAVTVRGPRPAPLFDVLSTFAGMNGDMALEAISWFGVVVSVMLIIVPTRRKPCWAGLPLLAWVAYLSIVNLGANVVIGYGWEWETLEVGFLIIFLCPLLPFDMSSSSPSVLVILLLRLGVFRIMYGAGMSKLGRNSSSCWKELTCTSTHYFTQPMPNPLAWWAHRLPAWFHKLEVLLTFFEQLVLPWFALVPHAAVNTFAAIAELFFQLMIVGTGNYAWINHIGTLPCLALLDDDFFVRLGASPATSKAPSRRRGVFAWIRTTCRRAVNVVLVGFIVYKSSAPFKELFGPAPWLHFYDDYFFVNAHGVFGFINQHRVNAVLEYTHEPHVSLLQHPCDETQGVVAHNGNQDYRCADLGDHCDSLNGQIASLCPRTCGQCAARDDVEWFPLDFYNLPGDVSRRPYVTAPYHDRLGWQVWIETTARMEQYVGHAEEHRALPVPGILRALSAKILSGDAGAMSLLSQRYRDIVRCDVESCRGPTAVRVRYFTYTFSSWDELWQNGTWWVREPISRASIFVSDRDTSTSTTHDGLRYCAVEEREWILFWSAVVAALTICVSVGGDVKVFNGLVPDRCGPWISVLAMTVFGVTFVSDYLLDHASAVARYRHLAVAVAVVCATHIAWIVTTRAKGFEATRLVILVSFAATTVYLSCRASGSCAMASRAT